VENREDSDFGVNFSRELNSWCKVGFHLKKKLETTASTRGS